MADLISRQAAIHAFKPLPTIEGLGLQPLITVDDAIKILNGLPPAQPELPSCGYCPFAKCTIDDDRPCSMKGVERVERLNQQTGGD